MGVFSTHRWQNMIAREFALAVIMIFVLALSLISFMVFHVKNEYDQIMEASESSAAHAVRQVSEVIATLLRNMDNILRPATILSQAGVSDDTSDSLTVETFLMRAAYQMPELRYLNVVTIDGQTITQYALSNEARGLDYGDLIARPHREFGLPFMLHNPIISDQHQPYIPVGRRGTFPGAVILGAFIDGFAFWDIIDSQMRLPDHATIDRVFVYNDNGTLYSIWNRDRDFDSDTIGFSVFSSLFREREKISLTPYGIKEIIAEDGFIVAIHPLEEFSLNVVVMLSSDKLLGRWKSMATPWTVITIGLSMMIAVAILYLNKQYRHNMKAQASLEESRQRYRDIATVANDWFWETDARGRVTSTTTPEFISRSMSPFPQDGSISRNSHFNDLIMASDYPKYVNAVHAQEPFKNLTWPIRLGDGEIRWIRASGLPHCDETGNFMGFRGSAVDWTDQRLSSEVQFQHERLAELGQMVGGVAHEFNNFLHNILNFSYLACEVTKPKSTAYQFMQRVVRAANEGMEIIQSLLTFSRMSDRKRELLPFVETLRESIKMPQSMIPSSIAVTLDIPELTDRAIINSTELTQIFFNLFSNAHGAMDGKGSITVMLSKMDLTEDLQVQFKLAPGNYLLLEVADTGHGIEEENLDKIFTPFFTTKPEGKGTGMGLSAVYGIVQSWNGAISVDSTPGKGTKFRIYVPIHQ